MCLSYLSVQEHGKKNYARQHLADLGYFEKMYVFNNAEAKLTTLHRWAQNGHFSGHVRGCSITKRCTCSSQFHIRKKDVRVYSMSDSVNLAKALLVLMFDVHLFEAKNRVFGFDRQ